MPNPSIRVNIETMRFNPHQKLGTTLMALAWLFNTLFNPLYFSEFKQVFNSKCNLFKK